MPKRQNAKSARPHPSAPLRHQHKLKAQKYPPQNKLQGPHPRPPTYSHLFPKAMSAAKRRRRDTDTPPLISVDREAFIAALNEKGIPGGALPIVLAALDSATVSGTPAAKKEQNQWWSLFFHPIARSKLIEWFNMHQRGAYVSLKDARQHFTEALLGKQIINPATRSPITKRDIIKATNQLFTTVATAVGSRTTCTPGKAAGTVDKPGDKPQTYYHIFKFPHRNAKDFEKNSCPVCFSDDAPKAAHCEQCGHSVCTDCDKKLRSLKTFACVICRAQNAATLCRTIDKAAAAAAAADADA